MTLSRTLKTDFWKGGDWKPTRCGFLMMLTDASPPKIWLKDFLVKASDNAEMTVAAVEEDTAPLSD